MKNADKPINPAHILIKEGGNAFLVSAEGANRGNYTIGNLGLSKREYFAGLAMQGILANSSLNNLKEETVAEISVLCANELLKRLEEQ